MTAPIKAVSAFTPGDIVVYPGHGVGKLTSIETQRVGEHEVDLFVISFEQDRMTLRVPLQKVRTTGLRSISTKRVMQNALDKLKQPAARSRAMWNRRALEYVTKINSGCPLSIAEVVRDLHRGTGEREQSYSERQLYEQALGRLTLECAAVEKTPVDAATAKLDRLLNAA